MDDQTAFILMGSPSPHAHREELPGHELVRQGVADLETGRVSVEALLLSRFAERLRAVGVVLPGGPLADPERRMYELLDAQYGPGAHGVYNAMTRRLLSYLRAAAGPRAS